MKKGFLLIYLLLNGGLVFAQDSNYVMRHIELDSLTVSATRDGFDVADFIRHVEKDTTFYKAFKTLRILSYQAKNNIRIFNKKGKVKVSLKSLTTQHRQSGCRTMEVVKEKVTGPFFKKDSQYNYYTARLYADLFFTRGKVCGETNIVQKSESKTKSGGALERHEEQLKQLIFNPGQPIRGIPFIGNKVAIFDNDMAPMYHFSIHSALHDSIPCYVFTAKVKPEFKEQAVINHLVTFFNKKNMEIVYRDYGLSSKNLLFHFDVNMQVSMTHFDGMMVPKRIDYSGDWKLIFKKEEDATFSIIFNDFSHQG